jgi:hypothetical protein
MNPDQVMLIVVVSICAWTVSRVFRGPLGDARLDFTERMPLQERQSGQLRPGEAP